MAESFELIAKTFFGLEGVLADEITALGGRDVQRGRRLVRFWGDTRLMMRANVHCRAAVRVLKPIHAFAAADDQQLYHGVQQVDWLAHLAAEGSLAIDPVVHSEVFNNSLFVAQRAKDAIVDQIRAATGRRPTVDLNDPDLRLNLHIDQKQVTVYLDSSGDSLHKRGYRAVTGEAPINEVLAAGILRITGWDERSPLSDFMCGSGTFLIEAALAARGVAPGLLRKQFGYMRWPGFSRALHEDVLRKARELARPDLSFPLQGSDLDPAMIEAARENARRAGVAGDIEWLVGNFSEVRPPAPSGTLVTNPPYDERMKLDRIEAVYRRVGDALKQNWADHTAFVFTGNLLAGKQIGLRPSAKIPLFNGPIECRLLRYVLFAAQPRETLRDQQAEPAPTVSDSGSEEDFRNRLTRMGKHWHRWARRRNTTGYRVYDRDIPEIPLSLDWYDGHLLVLQYDRPHPRTAVEQQAWLKRIVTLAAETLQVPPGRVVLGFRDESEVRSPPQVVEIVEESLRYEARLSASRETGIDLDQRIVRSMVREEAAGRKVLSLFAGAGTYAVAAAAGGATASVSVDASAGRLEWAERNLRNNGLSGPRHERVCQDPLEFVRTLAEEPDTRFDLIVLEPPGFDGQRREGVWNVQDGHVDLIASLLAHLNPEGKIYLISSFRRLTIHADQLPQATVREITRQTVPDDFRNKKVHRAWQIRHR